MRYVNIESVENGFVVSEASPEHGVRASVSWVFNNHTELNEFLFKNMPTQKQYREGMKKNEVNQA